VRISLIGITADALLKQSAFRTVSSHHTRHGHRSTWRVTRDIMTAHSTFPSKRLLQWRREGILTFVGRWQIPFVSIYLCNQISIQPMTPYPIWAA